MPDAATTNLDFVRIDPVGLPGLLGVPLGARGLVIFAHGSGSSHRSPRNNQVAAALRRAGFATLLLDLLTPEEEADRRNVFDIDLLASRLELATEWAGNRSDTGRLVPAYFGASTGAAAALAAAARTDSRIGAIVSRGGRPDLALDLLPAVRAPTLFLVGSLDGPVIGMNERAYAVLGGERKLIIIEGAGHLFEEPGTLDEVIRHAIAWFRQHIG